VLSLETVKKVLKDARLRPPEIDDVVLVGGSTRIPKMQEMLQEYFGGKELCRSLNPDEAVAYGAAVQGAILNNSRDAATANLLLMDVTPLSLGIETTGRVMSVIIPRNTSIPCVKTQSYTTEENYQTEIDVCVYEGERSRTDENNLLGKFTISGIERAKRGVPKIDVSFALDSNGILQVTARDQTTMAEARIEIERSGRSSDADIERMVREAARYRLEDEERVKRVEAFNELEALQAEGRQIVNEMTDAKKAAQLEQALDDTERWAKDNEETAKVAEIKVRRWGQGTHRTHSDHSISPPAAAPAQPSACPPVPLSRLLCALCLRSSSAGSWKPRSARCSRSRGGDRGRRSAAQEEGGRGSARQQMGHPQPLTRTAGIRCLCCVYLTESYNQSASRAQTLLGSSLLLAG
jgi:hypothetical protein